LIWRRDSGSPLQASAIPSLIRIDEIRFFRPTGDIRRKSLRCGAVDGGGDNCLYAARLPWCAIDPSRPRLADDRIDFGSLVLGSPIAYRDQPPNLCRRQRGCDLRKRFDNRAAHSRIWIEQEQNRGAARFGNTCKRQAHGQGVAGFRRHGMTAFDQRANDKERIAVAGFEDAGESGVDVGRKRSVMVPVNELICRRRCKLR
jgi:hypothetical protein